MSDTKVYCSKIEAAIFYRPNISKLSRGHHIKILSFVKSDNTVYEWPVNYMIIYHVTCSNLHEQNYEPSDVRGMV